MCGLPPPLKDALYITVNTLQLSEHTRMPGWQRDCGVRTLFYTRPVFDSYVCWLHVFRWRNWPGDSSSSSRSNSSRLRSSASTHRITQVSHCRKNVLINALLRPCDTIWYDILNTKFDVLLRNWLSKKKKVPHDHFVEIFKYLLADRINS